MSRLDKHYILVDVKPNRFGVRFSPDLLVYYTDETLPDKIKYAIASRGARWQDHNGYMIQLEFSVDEATQIMKEAGVGVK